MRRLVVAIDYGTSNSGAAYTIVDDDDHDEERNGASEDTEIIRDWPHAGRGRDGSEKVPSDIVYDGDGKAKGHGFEASRHDTPPLQWVKVLLEPESFTEQSNRTSQVWDAYYTLGSKALRKRPVDVVSDYLRWLWKRIQDTIMEKESENEHTDLLQPEHLTVVLTVPASWSAPAKQRMATAAVMAGIPEQCIKMLAEPEAAAVFGLKKKARHRAIGDGDCVIICDAGGGTVDAVAYRVRTREPLSLEQVTVSTGDFCGSSFVSKEFNNQLQLILGDKYDALSPQARAHIDEEFEYNIKRTYNPLDDQSSRSYSIPVDGLDDDVDLGIQHGRMKIDEAVIVEAFDSVMTQIMTLIDAQSDRLKERNLHTHLKGLLLVGGFGKSAFLRHRLKQAFPERNDLKVWAADDSWTAVVRGAVACEASFTGGRRQSLIHSRLSAYNYGVPFVQGGQRKVHWLVRKGQSVQSNMCTEAYKLRIDDQPWLDQDERCLVYVPIVASSESGAGDDHNDTVTPHAEIKCRVPTALRFHEASTEIQTAPSRAWHIPAMLVLYFDGALISFRCKIEDKEVGVAEVSYFKKGDECDTIQDATSEAIANALEKEIGKHERADSKISISVRSSNGSLEQQRPSASLKGRMPSADKDSMHLLTPSPLSSPCSETPAITPPVGDEHTGLIDGKQGKGKGKEKEKKKKRTAFLTGMFTTRDVPPPSSPPAGPLSPLAGPSSPPRPPLSTSSASMHSRESSMGGGRSWEEKKEKKEKRKASGHWAAAIG